jgi:SAM-dependent methyltransferase
MTSTDRAFFEQAHAHGDPWDLATDPYEQRRYDTVVTHVPPGRYGSAFEPGCSIGELTARLAARCEHIEAIDLAASAIRQARRRCQGLHNVTIRQGALPDDIPERPFDLIAFVEIGYYFTPEVLTAICRELDTRLAGGGRLVAAHWIGRSPDHVMTGEAVHDLLRSTLTAGHQRYEVHPDPRRAGFVLDVWDRPPSVAS